MEEITFDGLCQNFDKVNENTDFMKDAHSKNITISDWNGLVAQSGKTLANVKNLYKYAKTVNDILAGHEERIKYNTALVEQHSSDIANHSSRLNTAESTIEAHAELLETHSNAISTQGTDISDLDTRVRDLENVDSGDRLNTVENTLKNQNIEVDTHTRAIDSLESQVDILNSAVGVPGNVGVALGDFAVALQNSIAGCLGYRYKAIDTYSKKIYLTSDEITYVKKDNPSEILTYDQILLKDNVQKQNYRANVLYTSTGWSDSEVADLGLIEKMPTPEYTVGELFTIKTRSTDFDRIAKINDITGNVVTYTNSKEGVDPLTDLTLDMVTQTDVLPDRYSFSVPTEPLVGTVVITKNSFSAGADAKAASKYGIAIGAGVMTYGDGAVVLGVDSEAGYQGIALGELVRASNRNVGMGYNVTNEAIHSVSAGASLVTEPEGVYSANFGYQNRAKHRSVFMAGEKLGESKADHQVILGIRPNVYPEMLFVLGNGNSEAMSNAFVVWNDGRVSMKGYPLNSEDLVNVSYLNNIINSLPMRAEGSGSVAQTGAYVENGQYSFAAVQGIVYASQAAAIGYNAKVNNNASYSIVLGANSEAISNHVAATVLGYGCKTGANKQTVLGQYNKPIDDVNAVLTVGNGTQDNIRKNALVVWKDGHLEAGRSVTESDLDTTLVTLDYVRALEKRVEWLERQLEN